MERRSYPAHLEYGKFERKKQTPDEWEHQIERSREDDEDIFAGVTDDVFGRGALMAAERIDRIEAMGVSVPEGQRERFDESLDSIQKELLALGKRAPKVLSLFFTKSQQPGAPESVDQLLKQYCSQVQALTNEELFERLKRYEAATSDTHERVAKKLALETETISDRLRERVRSGELPIDSEVLEQRLSTLRYSTADALSGTLEEVWGDYDAETHSVRVAFNAPADQRSRVLTYEVVHAISARLDVEQDDPTFPSEFTAYPNLRSGLRFSDSDKDYGEKTVREGMRTASKLRWLNEAITETVTGLLMGEAKSYPAERQLLQQILEVSGVDLDVFLKAYFESYDQREGHNLPMTLELFESLDASPLGKGFLMRLDRYLGTDQRSPGGATRLKRAATALEHDPERFIN